MIKYYALPELTNKKFEAIKNNYFDKLQFNFERTDYSTLLIKLGLKPTIFPSS